MRDSAQTLVGLAHGDPDVGVEHVRVLGAFVHVLGQSRMVAPVSAAIFRHSSTSSSAGNSSLGAQAVKCRPILAHRTIEGVAHVVAGVAHVGEAACP